MDIQIRGGRVVVTHRLKRDETYRIHSGKKYKSVHFFTKPQECVGFSSRTESGKHILVLDYDNIALRVVESDIELLQRKFFLSPAYIFSTKINKIKKEEIGNFHVIFLSTYSVYKIYSMLNMTHIDENYKDSPLRNVYRSWVLRLSPKKKRNKPQFLKMYLSKDAKYVSDTWYADSAPHISTAHKKLLSKLYKAIEHPAYDREDGGKKVFLEKYETLNG